MKEWLRVIVGAIGIGLIWGALWAAAGAVIAMLVPSATLREVWVGPAIGMHPGFVGGVVFSALLALAARPRRSGDLSPSTVVACGGAVGFVLGVLPLAINKPPGESPVWLVAAVVIGSMTLMSAATAAGSLPLLRRLRPRSG